jgi:hypothetical protein
MVVDIDEAAVLRYQEDRLREKAAPKSINEEVRFLLKMLEDSGEVIQARLRKKKQLKLAVRKKIGKAFDREETESLAAKARTSRSPHMYPAFMLASNAGLRDTESLTEVRTGSSVAPMLERRLIFLVVPDAGLTFAGSYPRWREIAGASR